VRFQFHPTQDKLQVGSASYHWRRSNRPSP
jgi:hypothetical protein